MKPAHLLLCLISITAACRRTPAEDGRRVIVIGVDGMDPGFVEQHWDSLPNLRRLRDTGGFRRLQTTMPPQSPVAWSTFITGLDPSGHGIYDFVHRDPKTLAPYSAMNRTEPPRFQMPLGPWLLPLSKAHVVSLRHGNPFWKTLSDAGLAVTMMRLPTNYPPVDAGRAIAGMGVPDLRGGFGTFSFYTDDPEEITRTVSGGSIVRVAVEGGRVVLPLEGPPNSLRKDERPAMVPIIADIDANSKAARISAQNAVALIRQGEWSDWIAVDFPLISHAISVRGMFRIYAKQVAPRFQLYVTPVNIDPRAPALPISSPDHFSREVFNEIGAYFTQGIAEDTAALRHGVFTIPEYLAQSRTVFEDERRLFRYSLRHQTSGFLFAYISVIDQNSHVLWGRYERELLDTYRLVDDLIGEALRAAPEAGLLVMSDHGFTRFDRSFQLNAWLAANGLLALNGPAAGEGFVNVDWSRTQAYALGLNGLYLNLRGREVHGIVPAQDRPRLLARIRDALLSVRDPETGAQVISTVSMPPESETAPDMIVGYAPGYRAAWNTGLGATAGPIFENNNDAWIGDHCIDPAAVPGVLLSNRTIRNGSPRLKDLPGSILALMGVGPPQPRVVF